MNDAPVNTVPGSQSTTVNTPRVFSSGNGNAISIADLDAGAASVQLALTATNGTLTLASLMGLTFTVGDGTTDATMTFTGTLANANTALNGLTFMPTTGYSGAATVTIVTNDQGNTGTGGALSDTDAVTVTMTGSPPVAVADAYTTDEDTTLAVPVTGSPYNGVLFNDTDAESDPLTAILVTNVATGTLSLATNGSFSYIPVANASGVVTFTYKANDGSADSNTVTVTITITAVNDAPVLTPTVAALAYTENAGAVVLDAGITATDVDSANLASATVTMTTNYVNGQDTLAFVTQNGITGTWTAGTGVLALSGSSSVANYQAALRSITYTNSSETPVTTARTVTFVANDGALNSTVASRQIAVTAVNDPPVNVVPGTQSMVKNARLTFSATSGNRISTSDPDAAASPVQVQLSATNGSLSLTALGGLTFSVGDGTSDATMTFSGTAATMANALAWIVYDPTPGFAGSASLQIVTSDLGNSGTGGTLATRTALRSASATSAPSLPTSTLSRRLSGRPRCRSGPVLTGSTRTRRRTGSTSRTSTPAPSPLSTAPRTRSWRPSPLVRVRWASPSTR